MKKIGIGEGLSTHLIEVYCGYCKSRLYIEGIDWGINLKFIELKCPCGQEFIIKRNTAYTIKKISCFKNSILWFMDKSS
jgi:hypothetical protein